MEPLCLSQTSGPSPKLARSEILNGIFISSQAGAHGELIDADLRRGKPFITYFWSWRRDGRVPEDPRHGGPGCVQAVARETSTQAAHPWIAKTVRH